MMHVDVLDLTDTQLFVRKQGTVWKIHTGLWY